MATGKHRWRRRSGVVSGLVGAVLVAGGGSAVGVAVASQQHAPRPSPAAAGTVGPAHLGPAKSKPSTAAPSENGALPAPASSTAPAASASPTATVEGPILTRSQPVAIDIPAIDVRSEIFNVGLNPDGTIQAPPLNGSPLTNEAAWYRYSPTPGQLGPSIIEGHIDSAAQGPSVFFRLGALKPGDKVYVTLHDGQVAVFQVSGVRQYPKNAFPTLTVYGNTNYAGLRLLTCSGQFDDSTHHYLANTVVFASLVSSHPASQGVVSG